MQVWDLQRVGGRRRSRARTERRGAGATSTCSGAARSHARGAAVGAAVTLALGLSACSGSSDGREADELAATTSVASSTTAAATSASTTAPTSTTTSTTVAPTTTVPEPVDEVLPFDGPRVLSFGHVEVRLDALRLSDAEPGSYLDAAPRRDGRVRLYVDTYAAWASDYPGRTGELQVADFRFVTADGVEHEPLDTVDSRSTWLVQPDRTETAALVFDAALDTAGASLRYDDGVLEPETIALDGDPTPLPTPTVIQVGGEQAVTWEGGCFEEPGLVSVDEVAWSLDAGLDENGQTIVSSGSFRAPVGSRWLAATVTVTATSAGDCGGTVVFDQHFRLRTVGETEFAEPINGRGADLSADEQATWVLGWLVPLDGLPVELAIGAPGTDPTVIAIPNP